MGKWCLQASSFIFDRIFVKLVGNQGRHKIWNEFEFRPDWISHFGVMHPWRQIKFQKTYYGNSKISWPILIRFYMYHQWDGGKAAFRFWSRFHQNCGCHGNRKLLLTYDGKNCLHANAFSFDPIFVKLAFKEDRHKISDKFEFQPDLTTPFEVTYPWACNKFPIDF